MPILQTPSPHLCHRHPHLGHRSHYYCRLASALDFGDAVTLGEPVLQTPAQWLLHRHKCVRYQYCHHHEGTHELDPAPRGIHLAMISLIGEKEIRWSPVAFTTEDSSSLYCCYRHFGLSLGCWGPLQSLPSLTKAELHRDYTSKPSPNLKPPHPP